MLASFVPLRGVPDLFHLISAEWLSAKTRMNSHHEQNIEFANEWFDHFNRSFGIERETSTATGVSNLSQCFKDVVFGFRLHVNGNRVCTGFDKAWHIVIGMFDHQMYI